MDEISYCDHCQKFTYFIKDAQGFYVCSLCRQFVHWWDNILRVRWAMLKNGDDCKVWYCKTCKAYVLHVMTDMLRFACHVCGRLEEPYAGGDHGKKKKEEAAWNISFGGKRTTGFFIGYAGIRSRNWSGGRRVGWGGCSHRRCQEKIFFRKFWVTQGV